MNQPSASKKHTCEDTCLTRDRNLTVSNFLKALLIPNSSLALRDTASKWHWSTNGEYIATVQTHATSLLAYLFPVQPCSAACHPPVLREGLLGLQGGVPLQ